MKLIHQISKAIGVKKTDIILNLIYDLEWETDRMSQDGKESLQQLIEIIEGTKQ